MTTLRDQNQRTLIPDLHVAKSFWSRARGLIGRKHLPADQGLWLPKCKSVHTFFMSFAIDLVFLDKQLKVVRTVSGVRPGRFVAPVWRADSVIELSEGFLNQHRLKVGEQLHVDSSVS